MPHSSAPSRPNAGDVCVICVHGLAAAEHYFYWPPAPNPAHGFYATRRDGSCCGPIRWAVLCEACFVRYAADARRCPFAGDVTWPDGSDFEITLTTMGGN